MSNYDRWINSEADYTSFSGCDDTEMEVDQEIERDRRIEAEIDDYLEQAAKDRRRGIGGHRIPATVRKHIMRQRG